MILKWHPDKNRDNESEATAKAVVINEAWDLVRKALDPEERAAAERANAARA